MEENKFNLSGKNVLVTGGTGFVGSHLVKKLISLGANVKVTYQRENPKSYFWTEKLNQHTELKNLDVRNYHDLFGFVTRSEIECIFHLAAQPIVTVAYNDPRNCLDVNIMGTVNIMECARNYKNIKAVVLASSDKAYGSVEASKKYLESDPLKGDHPYDVSKSCADLIAQTYWKTYQLPVTISRFGNIYGEGDLNYSRLIPIIMKSTALNQVLELRSNGLQVRDYLYVSDVVNAYIALAENIQWSQGEAFNFGSNDSYSAIGLLKISEKHLNKKIDYKVLNNAKNEILFQSLIDDKARNTLGWERQYSYAAVIKQVYDWYRRSLS